MASKLMRLELPIFLMILATAFVRGQSKEAEVYEKRVQVTPLLRTTTTSAGQPIVYPEIADPEVTAMLVEIPAGAETGWHKHPFPCYAYILSGEILVDVQGGATNHFTAGQAFAESVDMLHNGRNAGPEPVRLVMFVTGEKGEPFTVRESR
jgi:quercetin dioxygenase-like cupin family protein